MARTAVRMLEVLSFAATAHSLLLSPAEGEMEDRTGGEVDEEAFVTTPDFCGLGHKAPQFFLLGGPKCGTTYFFDAFARSPGVALYKPRPGEPEYHSKEPWVFRANWDVTRKGAWLDHYPKCEKAKDKVAVDATPGYFGDLSAPHNIKAAYVPDLQPNIVFMVFLRDPVMRTHSHYYQYYDSGVLNGVMKGCTPKQYPATFQKAANLLVQNDGVVCNCDCDGMFNASMYSGGFGRWFNLFEARQFHVVPFGLAIGKPIVEYTWRVLGMPPANEGVFADPAKQNGHTPNTLEQDLTPEALVSYKEFMDRRAGAKVVANVLAGSGANLFHFYKTGTVENVQSWLKSHW